MNNSFTDIDSYIASFPPEVQEKLQQIRHTIRQLVPEATEAIKYAIPTFVWNGNLVHFAAFKHHIGFYPAPTGMARFEKELAPYKQGKGSVLFPLDQKLPIALISKIVLFRVGENRKKEQGKKINLSYLAVDNTCIMLPEWLYKVRAYTHRKNLT